MAPEPCWTTCTPKTHVYSSPWRKNHQLSFQDVLVQNDNNNKLHTTVHRKPTHKKQYLHYAFNHRPKPKKGIISTLQDELTTSVLPSRTLPLNWSISTKFSHSTTDQLVQQTVQIITKKTQKSPSQQPATFVISLRYFGTVSHKIHKRLQRNKPI